MQILLALIAGAAIGAAVHVLLPERGTRGVALAPVIGAASAGLAWTILTWLGVGLDSPWLWLSAILVPIAVTWPIVFALARSRVAHDARERARQRI